VRIYDDREDGDLRLLAMKLLSGGSLAQRAARGLATTDVRDAGIAAAAGLRHAHEQGIFHRDSPHRTSCSITWAW
jgi:serine/threonine protein kinase